MNRTELADLIVDRLDPEIDSLRNAWMPSAPINQFVIDDLLPEELARSIRAA